MAGLSLSVPLKIATELDFTKSLKKQFKKSSELDVAIGELNKLRNIFVLKQISKSESTLHSLYRYYDQLITLSTMTNTGEMKCSFTWGDSLEKGNLFGGKSITTSSSIEFEKICVLFNIAALQSQLGSECSDSDEELKTAAKLFQSSAGIFNELAGIEFQCMVTDEQTLTPDLNANTLTALSALMLAQAQEMFVTKAIKDAMKDAIIAKLSVQAVDMYTDALGKMTKDTVRHLWDRAWLANMAGKQAGYEALSNFFQSKVCDVNKRIGEQISRLNACIEGLRKAQEKMGNTEFLAYYMNEGTRLKADAQKDNDFIYHEPVPDFASLPTIARAPTARLAKLSPVPESFSLSFQNLFAKCKSTSSPSKSPSSSPGSSQPGTPKKDTDVAGESSVANVSDAASPTLTEILNTSAEAVGNYLNNYLFGKRRQQ